MITRDHQAVTRELNVVEHKWLLTYFWVRQGGTYTHPKIHQKPDDRPYSLRDAVTTTRANLWLGWPSHWQ